MKEQQKLTRLTARKYQAVRRREKSAILNTFTAQTSYGRKYAIHLLANEGKVKPSGKRIRLNAAAGSGKRRNYPRVYDEAVRDALALIWEVFNRQCGKLPAPFLPS